MRAMSRWFVLSTAIAAAFVLPNAALAVFPGVNGEIVFSSGRPNDDGQAKMYRIDNPLDISLTGPAMALVSGQHRHPNWSPDAKTIVLVVRDGSSDDVWLHSAVGLGSSNFTQSAAIREDHPTFSPDGTKIAYESEVTDGSNQTDILIENVNGSGSPVNLTNSGTLVESTPVWSPDGQFIYYASKASMAAADYDVMREPADNTGSAVDLLDTMSATAEWQPEISPDGTKVCFTFGDFGSASADIHVANIDGSGTPFEFNANDTATPIADYNCAWSPDGQTIGFTRGAFSAGNLYFGASSGAGDPTPYGNNDSDNFDGNLDWARAGNTCQGKIVTILGTGKKDNLTGTPKRDVAVLLKGDDHFNGRGGNDIVCGGPGDDTERGGGGRDILMGGPGGDTLRGGPGKDRCVGGPGADSISGCE